jgi:hypothetical protein
MRMGLVVGSWLSPTVGHDATAERTLAPAERSHGFRRRTEVREHLGYVVIQRQARISDSMPAVQLEIFARLGQVIGIQVQRDEVFLVYPRKNSIALSDVFKTT